MIVNSYNEYLILFGKYACELNALRTNWKQHNLYSLVYVITRYICNGIIIFKGAKLS